MTDQHERTARAATRAVSISGGMTITDGAAAMVPPMPRRELQRRLVGVEPVGKRYGTRGRRAAAYPVDAILTAHATWMKESVDRSNRRSRLVE